MYYGVEDIELDGQLLDETSDFSQLVADNRVNHLIEKGHLLWRQQADRRGLIFCSRKDPKPMSYRISSMNVVAGLQA